MANHTPGPWELTAHEDRFEIAMGSALDTSRAGYEPQHMVTLDWETDEGDDEELSPQVEEGWANARLMTASPDLLAACQAAVAAINHNADSGESDCDCDGDCETAFALWTEAESLLTAAIAKARGEASRGR